LSLGLTRNSRRAVAVGNEISFLYVQMYVRPGPDVNPSHFAQRRPGAAGRSWDCQVFNDGVRRAAEFQTTQVESARHEGGCRRSAVHRGNKLVHYWQGYPDASFRSATVATSVIGSRGDSIKPKAR
jgi:hypothetical protein